MKILFEKNISHEKMSNKKVKKKSSFTNKEKFLDLIRRQFFLVANAIKVIESIRMTSYQIVKIQFKFKFIYSF